MALPKTPIFCPIHQVQLAAWHVLPCEFPLSRPSGLILIMKIGGCDEEIKPTSRICSMQQQQVTLSFGCSLGLAVMMPRMCDCSLRLLRIGLSRLCSTFRKMQKRWSATNSHQSTFLFCMSIFCCDLLWIAP